MHSRASYPHLLKTLFLLEHLPEPVTCTGSLHVLGLVFNAFGTYSPLIRLTAVMQHSNCVTQSISLSNIQSLPFLQEGRALRLLKPVRGPLFLGRTCFWIAASFDGGNPETAKSEDVFWRHSHNHLASD
jgi:hypothetical protein